MCVGPVTDDFDKGDQFAVYDFGAFIGQTSAVPVVSASEVGPAAAFLDPTYSSGSFLFGPGAHSITIDAFVNPFGGGRGYLQVVSVPVPEPSLMVLLGSGVVGFAIYGIRRRRLSSLK